MIFSDITPLSLRRAFSTRLGYAMQFFLFARFGKRRKSEEKYQGWQGDADLFQCCSGLKNNRSHFAAHLFFKEKLQNFGNCESSLCWLSKYHRFKQRMSSPIKKILSTKARSRFVTGCCLVKKLQPFRIFPGWSPAYKWCNHTKVLLKSFVEDEQFFFNKSQESFLR